MGLEHIPGTRFQRAFVATSYLLGVRGAELAAPLGSVPEETRRVARGLGLDDRQARATVLAAELGQVARDLEELRYR